ncbi:ATP binding / ATPase [Hirschfeldia incana]|nr:ATP binding / ATPase [Hirschfeldia incana]
MALSGTLQLTSSNYIPGYGVSDSRSFSNSVVSRRTLDVLPFSSCLVRIEKRAYAPKKISSVCRASSSGHRRNNPDFSRNNRNGFRGNRNRRNEDRDGLDGGGGGLEDSEMLSSKNGPVFSLSSSPKFQATSSPGPREKEIVDLFRKVQAQLRARAAAKKEDKKTEEASKGQGGKETETVDSLLKLLRKHSGEQSKKNVSNFDSEKQLQGDDDAERQVHSSNHFDSGNRDHNATRFTRPASSFRRNSPVPRHKPQSSYSGEASFDEASSYSVTWTQKKDQVDSRDEPEYEPEPVYEHESEPGLGLLESEPELKPESFYNEEDEDHDVIVDELSDDDDESVNAEEETEKDEDLSALKLIELRAIAKSRGLKGISKMKKAELLNLLCSNKA